MADAENANMDRRAASAESILLLDFRVKALEDQRLPYRLQSTEQTVANIQAEVKSIGEISRGFGVKLDQAVDRLGKKQDAEYQVLRDAQLKFIASIRAVMWVGGFIGTLVAFAPVISKVFVALAG